MADKRKTIKVAVYVVLEIDPDAYRAEYGTQQTNREIASDVKWSAFNAVAQTTFPEQSPDGSDAEQIIVSATLGNPS